MTEAQAQAEVQAEVEIYQPAAAAAIDLTGAKEVSQAAAVEAAEVEAAKTPIVVFAAPELGDDSLPEFRRPVNKVVHAKVPVTIFKPDHVDEVALA